MSNDNDPRDEAMREIEAALAHYAMACIDEIGDGTPECYERTNAVKGKLLALIRSKLPQPDAEHERAVEAWRDRAGWFRVWSETLKAWLYDIDCETFDEALRLMRARPATCKDGLQVQRDKAAAELLRAADELLRDTTPTNRDCFAVCNYVVDDLRNAIEAAKRARPASGKDEAAGELLRAAKEAWPWVYGHPKQSDELWQAIAKAERAGIK